MKNEKKYLLTYYIKNRDEQSKGAFPTIPYKSVEVTTSEDRIIKLIEADMKKNPFILNCTVMDKEWAGDTEWHLKFMVKNLFYSEEPIPHDDKPIAAEERRIDDYVNRANMTTYDPSHQGFEIKLDHEQKVIRLGSYFYDLKGVLICEATDEDRQKYYCNKYVTFPIVDNDWLVYDGDAIANGIENLIVSKKGDTIPLAALSEAADYNAREHDCDYEDQLIDLERHGITVSNRKSKDSAEELSDNIVISIDKLGDKRFRMNSDWGDYYIPKRFFYVGDDDELYESDGDDDKPSLYHQKIITRIVDDVYGLSWFFNKPKLRVLVTAITYNGVGSQRYQLEPIPKDWFYTVQTLEGEINRELEELHKKYPNEYNKGKRPDVFEEKK